MNKENTPENSARTEANKRPMTPPEAEAMNRTALEYIAAGLSVIPVRANDKGEVKDPALHKDVIQPFRTALITPDQFADLTSQQIARAWRGLGVVCGPGSGGFECVDVDLKADPTGLISEQFMTALKEADPDLYSRLVIAGTPSGGLHFYYRRDYAQADPKEKQGGLAFMPGDNGKRGPALIETRILGGYAVVPPTDGRTVIQGRMEDVPTITEADRALIFGIARSLTRWYEPDPVEYKSTRRYDATYGERPGDHYNREEGNIEKLLTEEGYKVWPGSGGLTFVLRPGSTSKTSGNIKNGKLWIWSTSTGLPDQKALSSFAVYTYLRHGGRFDEAARQLRLEGYGSAHPGDVRPTVSTISVKRTNGEIVEVAAPGRGTTLKDIIKDADIAYVTHLPTADRTEVWEDIQGLDVEYGPDILVRQVDPETGEVTEGVLSSLWMLNDILSPYVDKDLTDEDQAAIMGRLSKAVRITKNGITRSRLIGEAVDWPGWTALRITRQALQDRLDAINREAEREERWSKLEDVTAELMDARDRTDTKALAAVVRKLEALTRETWKTDAVGFVDPAAVEDAIINSQDGLLTGWESLDTAGARIEPGTMTIVGARTGVGKTCFMVSIATRAAIMHPDRVFYYVFYEEAPRNFYIKLLRHFAGYFWTKDAIKKGLNGTPPPDNPELFYRSLAALRKVTHPTTGSLRLIQTRPTLESLEEHLESIATRGGNVGGVFVDHATIARVADNYDAIRDRVNHVSRKCQDIAITLDTPVVVAAQLNRQAETTGAGQRHIKESGNLEEDAGAVFILETEKDVDISQDEFTINVKMTKDRDAGKGKYPLIFYTRGQRMYDLDKGVAPLDEMWRPEVTNNEQTETQE